MAQERREHGVRRTAEFVGMERSALHRKLKGLGWGSTAGRNQRKEKFLLFPAFAGNCTGLYGRSPRNPLA